MTPRIRPGTRRDIGTAAWAGSLLAGRVQGTEPPAFITVLGRGRRQFWGWLAFAGSLMPFGSLARTETEAVILHVSAITQCAYENAHHQHLGRRAGLSEAQIGDASNVDLDAGLWSERTLAILKTARTVAREGDVDDATWQALRAHTSDREALEVVQLAAHYVMLATTLRVLRVEPDRPR